LDWLCNKAACSTFSTWLPTSCELTTRRALIVRLRPGPTSFVATVAILEVPTNQNSARDVIAESVLPANVVARNATTIFAASALTVAATVATISAIPVSNTVTNAINTCVLIAFQMKKGAFPAMNKMRKKKTSPIATPQLRFTPTAWAKLLYLRDIGETEVGGFGVCPNELLLVEDIRLISQTCSYTTVSFADDAVANYFDEQVDQGLRPEQFARVWIHTHPGASSEPSQTDEKTFSRVFGQSNWAVMFILACGGSTYTRLRFNQGPTAELRLSTEFDFQQPFGRSDFEAWEQEYFENVSQIDPFQTACSNLFDQVGYSELLDSESFNDIYLKMWQELQHEDEFDHECF